MRIIFMGTPNFAIPALEALNFHEALNSQTIMNHDIVGVFTQPPRPTGRGLKVTASPVQQFAEKHNIDVFHPDKIDDQAIEIIQNLNPDIIVVVAYGLILPKALLDIPLYDCINIHPSLLPRWRGAAPIQRAIMAGDRNTAVCIMQMNEGLDEGPILAMKETAIQPHETAGQLHDRLADIGAQLLCDTIIQIEKSTIITKPQSDQGISYAAKIKKSEAQLNWSHPAQKIAQQIDGLSPYPCAWFEIDPTNGNSQKERIKILSAMIAKKQGDWQQRPIGELTQDGIIRCGTGGIQLLTLQRPGKKAMPAQDVIKGLNFIRV